MSLEISINNHLVRLCYETSIDEGSGDFLTTAFQLMVYKNGKVEDCLSFDLSEFHKMESIYENIKVSANEIINRFKNKEKKRISEIMAEYNGKIYNNIKYFAIVDTTSLLKENKLHKNPIDSIKLTNKSHAGVYFNISNQHIVAMILAEIANKNRNKFKNIDLTIL